MIRLALTEDHTIVRWALREALSKTEDIEVVGEAGTAEDTLAMIRKDQPDVLLLDLSLPDGNGIELLSRLRTRFTRVSADGRLPAIAISGSVYEEDVARTLQGGFVAHLAKPFDEEGLIGAVQKVVSMLD